jgi:signal transduction histidine kinase
MVSEARFNDGPAAQFTRPRFRAKSKRIQKAVLLGGCQRFSMERILPFDRSTDAAPSAIWVEERREIGRLLHDGILQDLTVLGFELSTLRRDAPPAMQVKLTALSDWVATRQAALRELVSTLADAGPGAK